MIEETVTTETRRDYIEEIAAAYALGALTDETDLREFERLVESGDADLSRALDAAFEASAALAIAAPISIPPASLKATILQAAGNQNIRPAQTNEQPSLDALRLKKRTRFFIVSSLVSGILLCILLALNVSSNAKLDRSSDLMRALLKQTDSLRAANAAISPKTGGDISPASATDETMSPLEKRFFSVFGDPDVKLITLASMPSGATRQHLFYSPKQKTVYLVYDKEHPLDASKTYQLSAGIGSRTPQSIGTFRIDSKKNSPVYSFPLKFTNPGTFSISVEPEHKMIFTGEASNN
jgi:anti-sigma-K factor RskA